MDLSSLINFRCNVWVTTVIDNTPMYPNLGLCRNCRHARRIESDRGSTFLMCKLSFEDARFAKYPRLPVLVCSGHRPIVEDPPVIQDWSWSPSRSCTFLHLLFLGTDWICGHKGLHLVIWLPHTAHRED